MEDLRHLQFDGNPIRNIRRDIMRVINFIQILAFILLLLISFVLAFWICMF